MIEEVVEIEDYGKKENRERLILELKRLRLQCLGESVPKNKNSWKKAIWNLFLTFRIWAK